VRSHYCLQHLQSDILTNLSFSCIIYIYICFMFCMLLTNFVNYVFLLLCLCIFLLYMYCSLYSVSLCCSVYCLYVNVYSTTATGCQPIRSQQNISHHITFTLSFHPLEPYSSVRLVTEITRNVPPPSHTEHN
jgi:hypothetical protein